MSTPLAPDVCATIVPGRTAEVAARPDTRPASSLSGTASSSSSALAATSGGAQHRGVGQPALRPLPGRVGNGAARDHDVVGALQRDAQRGSYPAGGDDPHLEPGRAQTVELHHRRRASQVSWFVPVPRRGYRTVIKTLRRWRRRRCGVRLSLRGAGAGRPRTGWSAAAPAVRRPTGHRIAARRSPRADRCRDGERWAAVAATSPALCPAARVVAVASAAAAATSPAPASRIRRCRSRGTPWNDVTCPTAGLAPIGYGFAGLAWRRFGGAAGMPSSTLTARRRRGFVGAR